MEYMIYVWAAVVAISLIVEFATQELASIWFAVSGVVSLILSAFNVSLAWQIPVFVVLSLALVFATRPLVKKFLKKETIPTNADTIIGETLKLLTPITEDENGTVKFKGVVWSATASMPLIQGESVKVLEIKGNTLVVEKVELEENKTETADQNLKKAN